MPSQITHFLQAQKALEAVRKIKPDSKKRTAFFWGAQGPDFLFDRTGHSMRKLGCLAELGKKLKRDDPALFLRAFTEDAVRRPENEAAFPYLLGMLCYFGLERRAGPFVEAQAAALGELHPEYPAFFRLAQVETALDVIALRRERGDLPTGFRLGRVCPRNRPVMEEIAAAYARVLRELFAAKVESKSVLRAEKDFLLLLRLRDDRTGVKQQFFRRRERRRGAYRHACFFRGVMEDGEFDYANIRARPWGRRENGGGASTEAFFDLFDRSVEESSDVLADFLKTKNLPGSFLHAVQNDRFGVAKI